MSAVNLVAVFVENKPGQTARITKLLGDAGVNLRWFTIANSGSFGVMRFLVDQLDTALRTLSLTVGYNDGVPGTAVQFGTNTFSLGAVPAPGAIALLGLAGLAGRRRR